ncbi:MAG: SMP-30/gluconolactonase/LRE family protein [Planctomycetota bacterium]
MPSQAELALDITCDLGEGPVWWNDCIWFVDVEGKQLHRYDPAADKHTAFDVPDRIGFAAPSDNHDWVIGQGAAIAAFCPSEGPPRALTQVEPADAGTRMNDGKCDPTGRLYAGTLHLEIKREVAALYRFDADANAKTIVEDVTISNGLAWNEAVGKMYFIDTITSRVDCFDWDADTGDISNRQPVVELENGSPDGMCIDTDGKLWVAMWGGARIACVDPDTGKEIDAIEVPAPNVTSCCFGGADLDELYITTATLGLDDAANAEHPHAGSLFVAKPGAIGLPTQPMK